jgi:hypothetical protein
MASAYSLPNLIRNYRKLYHTPGNSGLTLNQNQFGRLIALLEASQPTATPAPMPSPVPTSSNTTLPGDQGSGGGSKGKGSFTDFFFPWTDSASLGFGIGGRIANAVFKHKAANQIARGNAPQHMAAALSTPQSQALFGNPLGSLAQISADAGQRNAAKSLAKGEAWQGSMDDLSNFISSVNTMRRLLQGDSLSAMGLIAMQRMATANKQRGP